MNSEGAFRYIYMTPEAEERAMAEYRLFLRRVARAIRCSRSGPTINIDEIVRTIAREFPRVLSRDDAPLWMSSPPE